MFKINNINFILRAFKYPNYRLFFAGQGISIIGSWMQMVAISWLVYRLSGSAFLLGLVGFCSQIPTFLLAPLAGVVADRFNRRKILLISEGLLALQAFILAYLSFKSIIEIWHIIALGVFMGLVSAFEITVRQTFVADIVEKKEDLGNAIALNSSMFNAGRLIGPAVAGILIAAFGEAVCFLFNAISFLAVIVALLAMRIPAKVPSLGQEDVFASIKEGFDYSFTHPVIRKVLLLLMLMSLLGMSYAALIPIFAKDILGGGPKTLGFLMAASGIGSLIGTMYLAGRRHNDGLQNLIPSGGLILGISLIAFSFSRVFWLSAFCLLGVGFGMLINMAASNTILQSTASEDKRGRVMSFYTMAFMGMAPFGMLLAGAAAHNIGAPSVLIVCGGLCVSGALVFWNKFKS